MVGGCALDLWNGKETSADEDLEFCCLSDDAPRFLGILKELTFSDATKGDLRDTRGDPLPPPPTPILLLKAKHCRPKDQFDLETALPYLSQAKKQWPLVAMKKEYSQSHWGAEIIRHISGSRAK